MGDVDLSKKRILFCPHEIGGQMQLMAEELRRRGHFATAATNSQEWYGHVNDIHLQLDTVRGRFRKQLLGMKFALFAAANYDIFHFFWGESLLGFRGFPHLDLPWLRRKGKRIFVHFRGTDVIDLRYFDYLRARTAGDSVTEPPVSRPEQARSLNIWRRYAHRMLIAGPYFFGMLPDAELVPQALDLNYWRPQRHKPPSAEDGVIRIAHAPSMRRKKGTEFVLEAVDQLRAAGHRIELVLIENVPYKEVKALYERCDIGVDQVLHGWYGKVSLELMALGKPVITYINPEWQSCRPDLPVLDGHPRHLAANLERLVTDAGLRERMGREGTEFVRRHHDVKVVIDQCLELYRESYQTGERVQ